MKYNFFIRNVEFDKRIEKIIDFGKKQGGFITREQLNDKLRGVDLYPLQLEELHEKLEENGIFIKVSTNKVIKDYNQRVRQYYFIDDKEVVLNGVRQINNCLTFEELTELFVARYDEKLTPEEKSILKQKLSNRVKHVETCKECLNWCKYGHELYNTLCFDSPIFPNRKFFATFDKDYQEWLQVKNKSEDQKVKQLKR